MTAGENRCPQQSAYSVGQQAEAIISETHQGGEALVARSG
jgi:hypothetical protein